MIWRMVGQRLALGALVLLAVTVVIFAAIELLGSDFAEQRLGQAATEETLAALREQMGLNRPAWVRYGEWIGGALRGEFGVSMANNRPIADLLAARLGNTLFLAAYAAVLSVPLSIGLGLLAALWRGTWFDRAANVATLTAIAFPEFFVAYILIYLVGTSGLFPTLANLPPGAGLPERLHVGFLPALTLTLVVAAHMMRMTRAAVVNLLAQPYIEMARLKGVPPGRVIRRHALPNALSPIVNVVALNLAYLVTGVVVVEVVFVYPGLGQLMVDAVRSRDVPVVQAAALVFAAVYVVLNLLADVLSTLSNPRLMHRR